MIDTYRMVYDRDLLNTRKLIIWCRGPGAIEEYLRLKSWGVQVAGFTDSFALSRGETFAGLPVIPYKEALDMSDAAICVASGDRVTIGEVLKTIGDAGGTAGAGTFIKELPIFHDGVYPPGSALNTEKIEKIRGALADPESIRVFDTMLDFRRTGDSDLLSTICERSHPQYFPCADIFRPDMGGVFVDCGAYDGATSRAYIEWAGKNHSKIYMMEPDPTLFPVVEESVRLHGIERAVLINAGAYSHTGTVRFTIPERTIGASRITEAGELSINVTTIDEMLNGDKATFIKMDIEGAEMEALKGAADTIKRYMPKLAISIYHKFEDLWDIPSYIHDAYPEYSLFIRHYTRTVVETVLYATI